MKLSEKLAALEEMEDDDAVEPEAEAAATKKSAPAKKAGLRRLFGSK